METKTNMQAVENTQVGKQADLESQQNSKGIVLNIDAHLSGTDGNEAFNLHITGDYICKDPTSVFGWYHNQHNHNHQHNNNSHNHQQNNNSHNHQQNNNSHNQEPARVNDMPTSTNTNLNKKYISDKEIYIKTLRGAEAVLIREIGSQEFEIVLKTKIVDIQNILDVFDKLFNKHPDSITYIDGSHMYISFRFGYYGTPLWVKSITKDAAANSGELC